MNRRLAAYVTSAVAVATISVGAAWGAMSEPARVQQEPPAGATSTTAPPETSSVVQVPTTTAAAVATTPPQLAPVAPVAPQPNLVETTPVTTPPVPVDEKGQPLNPTNADDVRPPDASNPNVAPPPPPSN